jgi:hypothetical protein
MSRAHRSLMPMLATVLVIACDADVLAPTRPAPSSLSAARATASGLSTWAVSPTEIDLYWPGGVGNETGWEIHRSTTGSTGSFTLRASLPPRTTSHRDAALLVRTEYCYKVRSFRNSGPKRSYEAFSNAACSTTLGPPAAAADLAAVPGVFGNVIVDISWTDRANDEQGFRIERAPDPAGPWLVMASVESSSLTNRSFSDRSGIPTEKQVCYRVIAFNTGGESASNVDCTAPPRAPSGIAAGSADAHSIDVSWSDESNVEDGYEVQRQVVNGAWQVVANLPTNTITFHDATVAADMTYQYRLRAKRDGGFSDFSVVVVLAAASRPPDAPVVRASPGGSSVVRVSWGNESPLASELRVERATNGQQSWLAVTTIGPGSGGLAGTGGIDDSGVIAEQEVCYRVIAHNAAGDSPPSNVDCTTPPAGPSNLVITTVEGGGRIATWSDNSKVEEGYVVATYACWPSGNCSYSFETVYPPNTTSTQLGLDQYGREEYIEYIVAVYDGGVSDYLWGYSAGGAPMTAGMLALRRSEGTATSIVSPEKQKPEQLQAHKRGARRRVPDRPLHPRPASP